MRTALTMGPGGVAPVLLVTACLMIRCGCESIREPVPLGVRVPEVDTKPRTVPSWAADTIWYQILVERFRNGDSENDPRPVDTRGAWPHLDAPGWRVTPWGHDWYRQDDWEKATGKDFYTTVHARRYGGDLQGVIDRLDHLVDLGVNALYLNPINDSPSLHKYDSRSWRHVDRNFGPDPVGDARIIAEEDPTDPTTWRWTSADRLFLALLEKVHARGLRVVVDYSFNHTGVTFWAWRDVVAKQGESRFAQWYDVKRFDDPVTPADEFEYEGWLGVRELPELREIDVSVPASGAPLQGDLHPDVKRHVFAVVRRWLDPNGDDDPSDGVDGFRLDVAERVPIGFWRDFRTHVKSINPDAFLVAELWWEKWPDDLLDPTPWLQGDIFDAAMNYRWYVPTRSFVAEAPPLRGASELGRELLSLLEGVHPHTVRAMMNVAASHDTPRLATSVFNPGKCKFRVNPRANLEYGTGRPDATARARQRLLLVQQFTWIGTPHIWYGDEVGMWGADDPDCRKPMLWNDITYEDESVDPFGNRRKPEVVRPDGELLGFYRSLIRLRRERAELFRDGAVEILDTENEDDDVFVFRRKNRGTHAVVMINRSSSAKTPRVRLERNRAYANALEPGARFRTSEGLTEVPVGPLRARILFLESDG